MSKRKSSPYSRNEDTSNSTDDDPMENDQIEVVDDLPIQNLSLQPTRNAWIPRWAKRIKTSISGAASDAASWLPSAFVQSVPKELWVRIEGGFPTGVTTEGCKNVDELKAIKKQLELSIKTSISGAASEAVSLFRSPFGQSVPKELWVRIEGGFPTGVTTEGCKNVDELKAIKKQLELRKPGNSLDPMTLLPDAVAKHGITSNTVLITKKIQTEGN
ncbi:hypothetical protein MP638_006447 [Amoeboaphelidium occidentale]|nr:hypothetical protein MP638_006447 [Amoeboaphelidium occidentale]